MAEIRHPEFIKELEGTKYPFTPTSTLGNGEVSLLEGTLLDAHIYAVTGTSNYRITSIIVSSSKIVINIGDTVESARITGEIALPVSSGTIKLTDIHNRSAGVLVSEPVRLGLIAAWGVGTHTFDSGQLEFCITCCMPVPDAGVTAIRLPSGEILSGKVWLVGEDGIVFQKTSTTNKSGQTVDLLEINAVGDPLFLQRLCNPEDAFSPVQPVRKIRVQDSNGDTLYDCDADDIGNFNIQMNDSLAADAALRVRTTPEGIVFQVEGTSNAQG